MPCTRANPAVPDPSRAATDRGCSKLGRSDSSRPARKARYKQDASYYQFGFARAAAQREREVGVHLQVLISADFSRRVAASKFLLCGIAIPVALAGEVADKPNDSQHTENQAGKAYQSPHQDPGAHSHIIPCIIGVSFPRDTVIPSRFADFFTEQETLRHNVTVTEATLLFHLCNMTLKLAE